MQEDQANCEKESVNAKEGGRGSEDRRNFSPRPIGAHEKILTIVKPPKLFIHEPMSIILT